MICKSTIFLYLILIFLISHAGAVFSQEISGTITDAETGLPLENVNVRVNGTMYDTTSQDDGRFLIERLAPGKKCKTVFFCARPDISLSGICYEWSLAERIS